MFGTTIAVFSLTEIRRIYPDEWVAIAVADTDTDGLPAAGEVLMHNREEQFVWSAARLGDTDAPIYVFYTGARRTGPLVA